MFGGKMEIIIPQMVPFALGLAMAVSIGLPFAYVIGNRKNMMLYPLAAGIGSYLLFALIIAGAAIGSLLQSNGYLFALESGLTSIVIITGHYIALKFVRRTKDSSAVPLSYGLGYSLINVVLVAGGDMFASLSLVVAVDNNGFEQVATTVEDPQGLYELVTTIVETPPAVHLLGGLELVCFFVLCVAISVLMWIYLCRDNKERHLFLIALAAQLIPSFLIGAYGANVISGTVGIIIVEATYTVVAAAAAIYAYYQYRKTFGDKKYMADPVQRL